MVGFKSSFLSTKKRSKCYEKVLENMVRILQGISVKDDCRKLPTNFIRIHSIILRQ